MHPGLEHRRELRVVVRPPGQCADRELLEPVHHLRLDTQTSAASGAGLHRASQRAGADCGHPASGQRLRQCRGLLDPLVRQPATFVGQHRRVAVLGVAVAGDEKGCGAVQVAHAVEGMPRGRGRERRSGEPRSDDSTVTPAAPELVERVGRRGGVGDQHLDPLRRSRSGRRRGVRPCRRCATTTTRSARWTISELMPASPSCSQVAPPAAETPSTPRTTVSSHSSPSTIEASGPDSS